MESNLLQSVGVVEDWFKTALSGERPKEVGGARFSRRNDCINNIGS
jgi:hypothetical protein